MFQIREGKKDFIEMKQTILMDEQELIKKAISILMRELGPVETTRFLSMKKGKRIESIIRHREWQSKLDKDVFFEKVFTLK